MAKQIAIHESTDTPVAILSSQEMARDRIVHKVQFPDGEILYVSGSAVRQISRSKGNISYAISSALHFVLGRPRIIFPAIINAIAGLIGIAVIMAIHFIETGTIII